MCAQWVGGEEFSYLAYFYICDNNLFSYISIFVIAEWATLLVDFHCPRGGS